MSGNLSRSMRENYDTHGVDEYYKIVGSSYRNPHFPGIKQCINILMNKWWQNEYKPRESGMLVCDLACGSGEVTVALQEWWSACQNQASARAPTTSPIAARPPVPRPTPASPPIAVKPGVARPAVSRPVPKSGASSLAAPFPSIKATEPAPRIVATDPYTSDAYRTRTGLPCITISFQDIAQAGLPDPSQLPPLEPKPEGEQESAPTETDERGDESELEPASEPETEIDREIYDIVICSFALHLLTSPGPLYALLSTLSYGARWLVVLEPHKKPEIKDGWGWAVWDVAGWTGPGKESEFVRERVHCRVYKSTNVA